MTQLELESKVVFKDDVCRATSIWSTSVSKWKSFIGCSFSLTGSSFLFDKVVPFLRSFLNTLRHDARMVWRPFRVCCREGLALLDLFKAGPNFCLTIDLVGSSSLHVSPHGPPSCVVLPGTVVLPCTVDLEVGGNLTSKASLNSNISEAARFSNVATVVIDNGDDHSELEMDRNLIKKAALTSNLATVVIEDADDASQNLLAPISGSQVGGNSFTADDDPRFSLAHCSIALAGIKLKGWIKNSELVGAPLEAFLAGVQTFSPGWQSRDLVPLPVPFSSPEETSYENSLAGKLSPAEAELSDKALLRSAGIKAWQWLIIQGLNFLYLNKNVSRMGGVFHGPPSAVQAKALGQLQQVCSIFVDHEAKLPKCDFKSLMSEVRLTYDRQIVETAHPIAWKNIVEALPPPDIVGVVDLLSIVSDGVKAYLTDDSLCLKPKHLWPKIPRCARVHVNDSDWHEVVEGLLKFRLCTLLNEKDIFGWGGKPLLSGLFGVPKGEFSSTNVPILRLIMNLIPLNTVCEIAGGDIQTLPVMTQLTGLQLMEQERILWSSEDLKCMFYLFSMPASWIPRMAFSKIACFDKQGNPLRLASRVLGMGWISSVGISQHVHRQMLKKHVPKAPPSINEWRKDQGLGFNLEVRSYWKVYLDNFDVLEIVPQDSQLEGSINTWQQWAREAYLSHKTPRHPKKAADRVSSGESQGCVVDGNQGVIAPKPDKLVRVLSLVWESLKCTRLSSRDLQVIMGNLIYIAGFRRPLMACYQSVWSFITSGVPVDNPLHPSVFFPRVYPDSVRSELWLGLVTLPLALIDLRAPLNLTVTASDASETGGGICASSTLTQWGEKYIAELQGQSTNIQEGLLVVSCFDGIGTVHYVLSLLGIRVSASVSIESCPKAARVVRSFLPSVLHFDDVNNFSLEDVKKLARDFPRTEHILLCGGPPCQGVSGLNARRLGANLDPRSNLHHHMYRIKSDLESIFSWAKVWFLMENVASMTSTDRAIYTEAADLVPLSMCPGSISWSRRDRLYWLNWKIFEEQGVILAPGQSVHKLTFVAARPVLSDLLDAGCSKLDTESAFPTFTRSIPRLQPGFAPAGIQSCDDATLQRWEADSFRFPPYTYQLCHLITSGSDSVRQPTVNEKERILGFPTDFTAPCLVKTLRKGRGWIDDRCSLLGNSWSVHVVAFLLQNLGHSLKLCPSRSLNELLTLIHSKLVTRLESFSQSSSPDLSQAYLLSRLVLNVSYKGTDVKLTPDSLDSPSVWPRKAVESKFWKWKVVGSWPFHHLKGKEHINALEMRAFLSTIRWRTRANSGIHCRFFHLLDSQVCLGIVAKGRTASRKLSPIVQRIAALLLAAHSVPFCAYVRTEDNPADRPSRRKIHLKRWRKRF